MSKPGPTEKGANAGATADEKMDPKEKEALADQMEEFEGPDRREKRGTETPEEHPSGVANS